MTNPDIPLFIATPLAGQGEVFNEDWMRARIDLFEAVTLPSMLSQLKDGVYWMIFTGEETPEIVREYVTENLEGIPHVYLMEQRRGHRTMRDFALSKVGSGPFITCSIADDDAWPIGHSCTVVETALSLISDGHDHFGFAYKFGMEWVISDIVDITFRKMGFDVIIPELLMEYNHPWIAQSIFVLQTVERPFAWMAASHATFPEWLEKENFSVFEVDEPKKAWLYGRHQLADSGIIKSDSKPIEFTLEDLQRDFGIDPEKVREWANGPYSSLHCEKDAHQKGHIEMYDLSDKSGFVKRPYNFNYLESGNFVIKPSEEFGVSGKCRLTVWDNTTSEHVVFINFDADEQDQIVLHQSIFPSEDCKFDIRMWNGEKWQRKMSYLGLKFQEFNSD